MLASTLRRIAGELIEVKPTEPDAAVLEPTCG
jgi:hypothetical protein